MRVVLLVVALAASATPALARQGLPQSVVEPYRAYQAALEAGDMPALVDASGRALDAARAEGLDNGTLGVLAENHAYALASAGRDAEAMEEWEDAARLGERAGLARIDLAWRWHNAAASALRADELQRARRWADEATGLIEDMSPGERTQAEFAAEAWFLSARIKGEIGQPDHALIPAREALALYEAGDHPPDRGYAYLHYLAGLASASMSRHDDAIYHMHMARDIATLIDDSEALLTRVTAIHNYFLEDSIDIAGRLAANPLHAARFAGGAERDAGPERPPGYLPPEPVMQDEPRYPLQAARRGEQGFVVLSFDIETDGSISNIAIVDSLPAGPFDAVSVAALQDWQYTPATVNGEPVREEGVLTHFHFRLR
ncbi:MAG: energy transducer TonB [Pseudomonadota bacterium]|nr:energy transducer TonB [Pseudomonadota bacterium]